MIKTEATEFTKTFSYKLIYIFCIDDEAHKGRLKIGDTTIHTNKSPDQLPANCDDLNESARKRIDNFTKTADINYNLLHTELAYTTYEKNGEIIIENFRDYDVHKILENSGYSKKSSGHASEWFEVDLVTAKKAIEARKQNKSNILGTDTIDEHTPIIFRPEQEMAIEQTINRFKSQKRMLWNAKMRFGKTLTALEVIKRKKFQKSIIITHRPVVDKGWYEDFDKIFYNIDNYEYGSKQTGGSVAELLDSGSNFIYFASIQDLRGSRKVGGTFDKNEDIFDLDWDFVIIDEAHEGTQTDLGQNVEDAIIKDNTKVLELSGTPFNIIDKYDTANIYTWDYVMEQKAKAEWDANHGGDSNPYEELPKMHIFTYDLGKMLNNNYIDIEDKAFNFKEFFRTWTGDIKNDFKPMPPNKKIGDFVHEEDIKSFLNLISHENEDNNYPFANKKYRDLFKHSFWLLPGVKEAKAFSKLLDEHEVFGSGAFEIVNVAGDGDDEDPDDEALNKVRKAIDDAGEYGYTITLSCGKLTTGVTVKEWTSVMYLSGSYSVSASNYLQTIFRAQSPCNKFGKMKTDCYVFDFAPDRTLKVVADAVQLSTKAGKSTDSQKYALGQFLNYCPVISIDNTGMKEYNVNKMLQQLKRAYADKAVRNGFDDYSLYNDKLMNLKDVDLEDFKKLRKIIGKTKTQSTPREIVINDQGLTKEDKEIEEIKRKPVIDRTPEEIEELEKYNELKKQKRTAISTLKAISIRMPLLIFGADIPITQDFKLEDFLDENIVDSQSWEEFMPQGVDRDLFKKFIKYYDEDIFIAAGNKIRHTIKDSDNLSVEERIKRITELHSCFKNPDKETVLTPWRVVNMHLSDCLGGWCFYDDTFDYFNGILEEPRYISHGDITSNVFNDRSQILEINSKTGLYQLYTAYSIYKNKVASYNKELSVDEQWVIWLDVIKNNIFIISKTPMAKAIAKRTLLGFRESKFNAYYFKDMINQFENKEDNLIKQISEPKFWNIKGVDKMKFNAIVGNPPYQEMDGGASASAKNIYHYFVNVSKKLHPNYISLIIPARWYTSGKGLDEFRQDMIHDKHIIKLFDYVDSKDIFPTVEIKGGICYFLRSENEEKKCEIIYHSDEGIQYSTRFLHDLGEIYIRDERIISIIHKIIDNDFETFEPLVSSRKPYGLSGDFFKDPAKYNLPEISDEQDDLTDLTIIGRENNKRVFKFIPKDYPLPQKEGLNKYKLFVNRAYGNGKLGQDNRPTPLIGKPNELCTETFLQVGSFESKIEAENALKYMETKLFKLLVGINKTTQDAPKRVYTFVPIQDFTESSDIDWNDSISEQLYEKYNLTKEEQDFIEKLIVK